MRKGFSLDSHANGTFSDHPVDDAVVVAQFAQDLARMLTDARRRPADNSFVSLESRGGLRLADPPDHRLIEFRNDTARNHLLIVNDFASSQDWRTRYIGGVQPLQPLGCGVLTNVLRHLVDARCGGSKR